MTSNQNTTRADNDNLTFLTPDAVRAVLRTAERISDERDFEEMLGEMLAGDGVGLLAADAMTQAVRRVGAWPLIDHVEAFFRARSGGPLATHRLQWAFDSIGWLRSGEMDLRNPVDHVAEMLCEAYLGKLRDRRESDSATWLERCVLYIGDLAVWSVWATRGDCGGFAVETQERATDDAGLEIATVLVQECGSALAWEFVQFVRGLDVKAVGKAA